MVRLACAGMFFIPPLGWTSTFINASVVTGSPRFNPPNFENISGRWTWSSSSDFPTPERPTTCTTWSTKDGMGGSSSFHAFNGFWREPSASISKGREWSSQYWWSQPSVWSRRGSVLSPTSSPVTKLTPFNWCWFSSSAAGVSAIMCTSAKGICHEPRWDVAVRITDLASFPSKPRASWNIAVVFPPAPANAIRGRVPVRNARTIEKLILEIIHRSSGALSHALALEGKV